MKHLTVLTIIALGVMLLGIQGCITVCPKQSVVEMVLTPFGPMIVETPKDTYNEKYHSEEQFLQGGGWLTLEEYEALTEKYKNELEQSQEEATDEAI